jgi:hypothetical protein
MKKKDVPLFEKKKKMGRPIKYDFTPFFHITVRYITFSGLSMRHYDTLRSCFARWRRRNGVEGRFEYDILEATGTSPCSIVVWRNV